MALNLASARTHPPTIDMTRTKSKQRRQQEALVPFTSSDNVNEKITPTPCTPTYNPYAKTTELLIEKVAPVAVACAVDCQFTKSLIFTILVAIFALLEFMVLVFDIVRSSGEAK